MDSLPSGAVETFNVNAKRSCCVILALPGRPALLTQRLKRLKLHSQGDCRVTRSMSAGVNLVIQTSNGVSALTDAVPDTSGWFDDDSLDSSGCFDSAADPKETCLDHGSCVRNNASCGGQTFLPEKEAFEVSTTGNV